MIDHTAKLEALRVFFTLLKVKLAVNVCSRLPSLLVWLLPFVASVSIQVAAGSVQDFYSKSVHCVLFFSLFA